MNWINFKTITAALVGALVAGTGTYLVQKGEIDKLRKENQSLLAHQEELTKEKDEAVSTATANHDELTRLQKDKDELIRLRGEVGALRRQTKGFEQLQAANQQLSSRLAQASHEAQQRQEETEAEQQKRFVVAKMTDAKLLMLGVLMFASDNQDQIPADINQTTNYFNNADSPFTKTNQFELVIQGSLKNITNPSTTIAVREREATVLNGKRVKAYGFADGHAEIKTEPPEGFEAWEKQHMIAPAAGQ